MISEVGLVSITVRNLDDELEKRLRTRARENGRSIEQEAREILSDALCYREAPPEKLGTALVELFSPLGGVDLEIPPREEDRELPRFD